MSRALLGEVGARRVRPPTPLYTVAGGWLTSRQVTRGGLLRASTQEGDRGHLWFVRGFGSGDRARIHHAEMEPDARGTELLEGRGAPDDLQHTGVPGVAADGQRRELGRCPG